MNEEIKQKADELVVKTFWTVGRDMQQSVKIAILSTKNTIDALNAVIRHDKERYGIISRGATIEKEYQQQILTELESRI